MAGAAGAAATPAVVAAAGVAEGADAFAAVLGASSSALRVSTISGGGAGGAKWKGMRMRLATGLPARMAGRKVHWRTATTAASSRSPPPDSAMSTWET